MNVEHTIQVASVWPGIIGGAIFRGIISGTRVSLICKASYKTMSRIPCSGEFWHVNGYMLTHKKYGRQLQVSDCHLAKLPSEGYVNSILEKHPAFRGFHFGKGKINKLMKEIGAYALVDLLNAGNVLALSEVINPAIAEKVVASWQSLNNEIEVINFLKEHNFDASLARKVIRLCKSNTIERLKTNPYVLICFGSISKNIWRTVEKIARNLNVAKNDERRLVGGVEHILYERLRNGHTAMPKDHLVKAATDLLGSEKVAKQGLESAISQRAICTTTVEGRVLVQPIGPALIEHSIECHIKRLTTGLMQQSLFQGKDGFVQFLIEKYAIEFERTYKFKLTDEQLMAIELALTNRCAVISGYGGTGKTTVQRAIADIAQSMNRTLYIMALSGKAKERAAQATGREAMTIHGFIKAVREGSEKIDIYSDPLIIIDEASMVDIALLNKLLSLFDDLPFSLLTVGDTAQLSPVGFGLAWHKMAKSNNLPAVHLTKVHRQATHSPIHKAAMDIREGISHQLPEWKGEAEGIYLVNSEATDLLGNLYKLKKALPQAQILTPHMSHRMHDSGHKINKYLQRQLQLSDGGSRGVILGGTKIFIGDPVIVTENNYELNLFNGMTGQLKSVAMDALGKQCGYFEFEGRDDQIELTVDQMFDVGLSLAYGITMHKAQGSEYEVAIVCCIVKSPLLERSLLYTSVTRAKKLMIIVGSKKLYDAALKSLPRAETLCTGICL